jgi:DNA-directed RNA polymerase specialized sigma subunit
MDVPIEVINAVKPTTAKPKARKPYVKKLTKRILHAIGNGLRTSASIAKALNVPKAKIQSNLHHIKAKGLVYSSKQVGSVEHKYHLTTDKPVLDTLDLTPKKKARKPYAKRATTYNKDGVNTSNSFNTPPEIRRATKEEVQLMQDKERLAQRLTALELTLVEKEKEVWTLECEVFDKKAIIKYLEEKLFVLGVK